MKREIKRIENKAKEKNKWKNNRMKNEENKEAKKKKERSGYSLGGPAAFLEIMPYK